MNLFISPAKCSQYTIHKKKFKSPSVRNSHLEHSQVQMENFSQLEKFSQHEIGCAYIFSLTKIILRVLRIAPVAILRTRKIIGYTSFSVNWGLKINRQYYQDMLLMQELLPVICSTDGAVTVFQQDNAPAHPC